ncbi:CHAT domain-containing protein [bacterium]|nr:CHAT domain-containing protein [bacterium]
MKNRISLIICLFMMHSTIFSRALTDSDMLSPDTLKARNWITQAEKLRSEFKFDSSSICYEKAGQIYEVLLEKEDHPDLWAGKIHCLNEIGYNHRRLGTYEEGLEILYQAQKLGKQHLVRDHIEIVSNYYNIGFILFLMHKSREAITHFQTALDIGIPLLGESHMLVNTNNICIGHVYKQMGYFDDALKYYQRFLSIAIPAIGENHLKVAYNYSGIADIHFIKGDMDKAVEYQFKSIHVIKNLYGENHPDLGINYLNLGNYYREKRDYHEALRYSQKALDLNLKNYGENNPKTAQPYNNIGIDYINLNNYDPAIENLNKAESILLRFPESLDLAHVYLNMGIIYGRQKEYDKAIQTYRKSGAIVQRILGEDHWRIADSKTNIGTCYYDKGDNTRALKSYQEVGRIYRKHLGFHHERTAMAYNNIANTLYHMRDYQQAMKYIQKSLAAMIPGFQDTTGLGNPELSESLSNEFILSTLMLKIEICRLLYQQNPDSLQLLHLVHETSALGIAWTNRIRTQFETEESRLILGDETRNFYRYAVESAGSLYQKTRDEKYLNNIFDYMEEAKFAVLSSTLHESEVKQFFNIPDSLLEKEKFLKREITYHNTEIQKELAKQEKADTLKLQMHQNRHFHFTSQYREIIRKYEQDFPEYYHLKYQIRTVSFENIQKRLNPDCALLEYFTADSMVYLFVISKENIQYFELDPGGEYQASLRRYLKSIKKVNPATFLDLGPELAEFLLPNQIDIASIKRLVIIPHGLLYKLPFESLLIQKPKKANKDKFSDLHYLIRDYEISYHYSATLYNRGFEKKSSKEEPRSEMAFVGFAPVFKTFFNNATILGCNLRTVDSTEADIDTRSISLDGKVFNALPQTEKEVTDIASEFRAGKKQGNIFLYNEASEEQFKNEAPNYRIVHIASHSIMNEKNPRLSGIIFSQPQDTTSMEDGVLYAGETYNLNLNSDLLVLSSCESGAGKLRPGEGLMSLGRGFFYAGVKNLLVSLWKVDDASTRDLMKDFYHHYLNGKSYAASLREAKLKLIENPQTAFPRTWSGFVLIGE